MRGHGIEFVGIAGDVREMLESQSGQAWLRSGYNPVKFARQFIRILEPFKKALLSESLNVCAHADAVIYSTLSFPVYHIAEALDVPCFYAPLQPMSRTHEIPYIQLAGSFTFGRAVNWCTHLISEQLFWQPLRHDVNMWRVHDLGLPKESFLGSFGKVYKNELPFLYGFSESVFPKPGDWPVWHYVTGYWFLNSRDWQPDPQLVVFLEHGSAPVYIGFGSMGNRNEASDLTKLVIKALSLSKKRGLLATGWNGLSSETDFSKEVFMIESAPHAWLFPRMSVVVHHGGAGTTAAGLRAGVPTIIIPHANDQFFWGRRIAELGVGPDPIPRKKLTAENLAEAINCATQREIQIRSAELGEKIKDEDGIGKVVDLINQQNISLFGKGNLNMA